MNKISWWRANFGQEEIQRISDSITRECISQGPVTAEFEQRLAQLLGVPYVVATTSGSTAILIALIAAGVGAQDEVIVPNRTWIATAHAPMLLGAKVVLTDVEVGRPIMDVGLVEKAISKRTKVVIAVHLNGRSADMDRLNSIAAKHGVVVIEDAAQAFYSRNRIGMLGTQSYAGCFSLSIAKIINTGQGGFVATADKSVYERLVAMRTHGVSDPVNCRYTQFGFNFRFTDIQAAIGLAQLDKLEARVEQVKKIYERYKTVLSGLSFLKLIPVDIASGEIPVYVEALCPERDRLVKFLAERNIQVRPFYPDLNLAGHLGISGTFANSKIFGEQGLFLPSGPGQTPENIEYVISSLKRFK